MCCGPQQDTDTTPRLDSLPAQALPQLPPPLGDAGDLPSESEWSGPLRPISLGRHLFTLFSEVAYRRAWPPRPLAPVGWTGLRLRRARTASDLSTSNPLPLTHPLGMPVVASAGDVSFPPCRRVPAMPDDGIVLVSPNYTS